MKSELEKIIRENPDLFGPGVPDEGHMERFRARLEDAVRAGKFRRKPLPLKIVAGIAGLAASVALMIILFTHTDRAGEDDTRFADAVVYFSYELRNAADQVRQLASHIDPAAREELLEDIESLETIPMDEIPGNFADDQKRIGILYEKYEARVNSLEMIVNSIANIPEKP